MLYHFPSGHHVLEQGSTRCMARLTDEEREARFSHLAAMRNELLLLAGDVSELQLLLRACDGELTCRGLANVLGVDPSTAWRQLQRRLQACRFAHATALASARFGERQAFIIDVRRGEFVR